MVAPDIETVEGICSLCEGIFSGVYAAVPAASFIHRAVVHSIDNPEVKPHELYDLLEPERTIFGEPLEPYFMLSDEGQERYILLATIIGTALWGGE